MNSKFNYNKQALIVGTHVLEIDNVSKMEYLLSEKKWLDVVIKTKSDITSGLISEETQIIYILKDGNLFHIKPCSTAIENNCLTIVPKSCGLLIENINASQH